jgi:hypothetical protein
MGTAWARHGMCELAFSIHIFHTPQWSSHYFTYVAHSLLQMATHKTPWLKPQAHQFHTHRHINVPQIIVTQFPILFMFMHPNAHWNAVLYFGKLREYQMPCMNVNYTWKTNVNFTAKQNCSCRTAFPKLWSADHRWSSGSARVVLLDWKLVQKRQKK